MAPNVIQITFESKVSIALIASHFLVTSFGGNFSLASF